MKNVIIVIVALFLIFVYPLAVIWALNTLFPTLQIGYSVASWASVIVLSVFARNVTVKA